MNQADAADLRGVLRRWWWAVLIGIVVLLPVIWWGIGMAMVWRPHASGFSQSPITFDAQDAELPDFLAKQFPGVTVRWETGILSRSLPPFSLRVTDMSEQEAMRFLAMLLDLGLQRESEGITVQTWPWWDLHYEQADDWIEGKLGLDLWPNR